MTYCRYGFTDIHGLFCQPTLLLPLFSTMLFSARDVPPLRTLVCRVNWEPLLVVFIAFYSLCCTFFGWTFVGTQYQSIGTKCVQCSRKVASFCKYITCFSCSRPTHLSCIRYATKFDSIFTNKDTNKWLCIGCAETILPFNNEDDEQLFLGNLSELWPPLRHLPQSIAALLEREIIHNPLDLNESENSPLYEIDPDLKSLMKCTFQITCLILITTYPTLLSLDSRAWK